MNPAAPPAAGPRSPEGLTLEVREWAGDDRTSWAAVTAGLKKSERVLANAPVAQVINNCNPARPDDPTRFAASYRGYLDVKKPGIYRFFLNCEDTGFLFIDGFKVCERLGNNTRVTGYIPTRSVGADYDLKAGVHPFEVHHVMGNNAAALGYCTLLWVPPGEKSWSFVPSTAFVPSLYAEVAGIVEAGKGQAACFVWGIDDALMGNGGTLYLTRFEAQGTVTDPARLHWDFGDGTTGTGRSVEHVYFKNGSYDVTLRSSDGLPAFKHVVHVWPVPAPTSPFSVARVAKVLAASDWRKLDPARLNQVFDFLTVCGQPDRWPLLEAVSRHLLAQADVDPQLRAVLHSTVMEAMAEQGKAREALQLLEPARKEFARQPTLRVGLSLTAAVIQTRSLKDPAAASKIYEALVEEHRRLEHPGVRLAAVRWGDLFADSGDLTRAAEAYRLAGTLGGDKLRGAASAEAVTRGALLRVAEQRLRGGDLRQTRHLLERIELDYPEQKLSGLYRFLRAESDRFGGRYEEAVRNYEFILKLTEWAGYHDRALHGIADSYFRAGDAEKALKWLGNLKEAFPAYYEKNKLDAYQRLVEARAKQKDREGAAGFAGLQVGFEPGGKMPALEALYCQTVPSMGLFGPHASLSVTWPVALTNAGMYKFPLTGVNAGGYYWVEFWYRGACEASNLGHLVTALAQMGLYDKANASHPDGGTIQLSMDRSYGGWRKVAARLRAPAGEGIRLDVNVVYAQGFYEVDGVSIRPVSDGQNDLLQNFIERAEKP
jgi:tetratricopeptide (TPR) repeat protein